MARCDIVIFGATGFTGKQTIPQVERLLRENGKDYTWAVAGRSESKLRTVLKEMGDKFGKDYSNTPLIIADVNDDLSLNNMAQQARLIINTCGPFQFYGEPVIKACVENGCHHLDISGEPEYIDIIQKYHTQAQEKGVYIVSTCGFDSIPADLGLIFLQSEFNGTLNSVETYLTSYTEGGRSGPLLNFATFESAVHAASKPRKFFALRKQFTARFPKFIHKLPWRIPVHKSGFDRKYALPFIGCDRSVVESSQLYLYDNKKIRPAQIETYFAVENFKALLLFLYFGGIFMFLALFGLGRRLLLKYPRFFTNGLFTLEGPSEEVMINTTFTLTLVGKGWSTKDIDSNAETNTKPDKQMVAKVKVPNPGYGATCIAITLCALTILDHPTKLPEKGGVYSPGAVFYETPLIQELHKRGITFEIVTDQ